MKQPKKIAIYILVALIQVLSTFFVHAHAQVSLPNGDFTESVEELRVKTLNGSVALSRVYFGGHWQFNPAWSALQFEQDTVDNSIKTITRNGADFVRTGDGWVFGTREIFAKSNVTVIPSADTAPPSGIPGQGGAATVSQAGYRWSDRNGNFIDYDQSGKPVHYGDRNNVLVWFHYNTDGKLGRVLDHFGRVVLNYAYNTSGQLTKISDNPSLVTGNSAAARSIQLEYASAANDAKLIKIIHANSGITRFGYGSDGMLINITYPKGGIKTLTYGNFGRVATLQRTDGENNQYVYDYDSSKKQFYARITTPLKAGSRVEERWYDEKSRMLRYDLNGKTVQTIAYSDLPHQRVDTDARGNVTTTTLDEFDNAVKAVYPDNTNVSWKVDVRNSNILEYVDEAGIRFQYQYDGRGNLIKRIDAAGLPEQRVFDYTVDSYGYRLSETWRGDADTADAAAAWTYDDRGNTSQYLSAEGRATSYKYDLAGNAIQIIDGRNNTWTRTFNESGSLLSSTDPLGHQNQFSYDLENNRIQAKDALNNVTGYTVDSRSRLTQITDALSGTWKRNFNTMGQMTDTIDPNGITTNRYGYDSNGRLTQSLDAAGNATRFGFSPSATDSVLESIQFPTWTRRFSYDKRYRTTSVSDELNASTHYTSSIQYDVRGYAVQAVDRNGKFIKNEYDALGRIVKNVDVNNGATIFGYDRHSRLVSVTDANGNPTRYAYDRDGRRVSEKRPLGQRHDYEYDANNNVIKVTDPKGNVIANTYDAANRKIAETHLPAGGAGASRSITYSYNAANVLTAYNDNQGDFTSAATYTSDALYRKTQETISYGGLSFTSSTGYRSNSQKADFTYPNGLVVNYGYDNANRLQTLALPGGTLSINEFSWNVPSRITYPGGMVRTHQFDALMRLTGIQVDDPAHATLLKYQYSFDPESNITQKATEHGTYDYQYDNLYRLTQVTNPAGEGLPTMENYTYDKIGNRLTDSNRGGASQWQYNANNQLTKSFNGNAEPLIYTYDANGSLTQRKNQQNPSQASTVNQSFGYGVANRLAEVRDASSQVVATYKYDPYGRRITKTISQDDNGQTLATPIKTYYIYAQEGLIAEANATGVITNTYGWGPNNIWGADPIFKQDISQENGAAQPEAVTYWYQNDHLGTPQKLIDQTGQVQWAGSASSFGETMVLGDGAAGNPLRFAGQYFDKETNLHYNYFRDYDPSTGRYVQSDPIGLNGGINTYAYVLGNPVSYIDPLGLICTCNPDATANAAKGHEGEWGWGKPGWRGGPGWYTEFKCNKFVNQASNEGGSSPPMVNNRPATAGEIGDPSVNIPDWPVVKGPAKGGDIIGIGHAGPGYTGHTGVVVGPSSTASANSGTGTITVNDWGFRPGQTPVIRRCTCQ